MGAYLVAAHAGGNYEVGGVDVWEGFGVFFETVGTCSVDELLFPLEFELGIRTEALRAHYISVRLLTGFILGELDLLADLAKVLFDP